MTDWRGPPSPNLPSAIPPGPLLALGALLFAGAAAAYSVLILTYLPVQHGIWPRRGGPTKDEDEREEPLPS